MKIIEINKQIHQLKIKTLQRLCTYAHVPFCLLTHLRIIFDRTQKWQQQKLQQLHLDINYNSLPLTTFKDIQID